VSTAPDRAGGSGVLVERTQLEPDAIGFREALGCSDRAVQRGVELAQGLGDTLLIAYATEPPNRSVGDEWGEARMALEELGRPLVDAEVARAKEAGVEAEPILLPKRPAEALVALAVPG
jgi:nucleotide-binding universal stress UspA family protein